MREGRSTVTRLLVAANVMMFIVEVMQGATQDVEVLFRLGALDSDVFERGDYWRLVTATFLHGGYVHLLLNMLALFQLGSLFEIWFGPARMALTYFSTGIAASVAATLLPPAGYSVGASGAIFGLIGALIVVLQRSPHFKGQPVSRGIRRQLIFWAGFNILIGFSMPQIDNAGHLGGLAAGLILGLLPHNVPPPPPREALLDAEVVR